MGPSTGGWVPTGQVHPHNTYFLSTPFVLACCRDAAEEWDGRQVLVTVGVTSEDTWNSLPHRDNPTQKCPG